MERGMEIGLLFPYSAQTAAITASMDGMGVPHYISLR